MPSDAGKSIREFKREMTAAWAEAIGFYVDRTPLSARIQDTASAAKPTTDNPKSE